jgi:hypothetical protein
MRRAVSRQWYVATKEPSVSSANNQCHVTSERATPLTLLGISNTAPVQFEEFDPLLVWRGPTATVAAEDYNLDRKNPAGKLDFAHLPPEQLVEDILTKERRILELMEEIRRSLATGD